MKDYLFQSSVEFAGALKNNYVDKTEIISYLNSRINVPTNKFICAVRPCRSGKSITAMMLNAYYSKANDTKNLFVNLKIGQDPNFENYLNKYHVLYIDMQDFDLSIDNEGIGFIDRIHKDLIKTLKKHFPKAFENKEFTDVALAIREVYAVYQEKFIFIIDEWDYDLRVFKNTALTDNYLSLLRSLFKATAGAECVALAYITGILPIKKYKTQSILNNFKEYSMLNPKEFAQFFGFTDSEVRELCQSNDVSYEETRRWYDGYRLGDYEIYNPNAIHQLIQSHTFCNYWYQTTSSDAVKDAIAHNIDDVKRDLLRMYDGEKLDIVDFSKFNSDISELKSKDAIITYLIHLGYLAYDLKSRKIYIPNEEIRQEFKNILKDVKYEILIKRIEATDKCLNDIKEGNEQEVAAYIESIHNKISAINLYNNETSLRYVVLFALYNSEEYYQQPLQELPSGKGFADLVYIPKPERANEYPTLIELKWDQSPMTALEQIKQRDYVDKLKESSSQIALIGINYNAKTKVHDCKIEYLVKDQEKLDEQKVIAMLFD